jgi:hypothetical protein
MGISPSQGLYLCIEQHKDNKRTQYTDIHTLSRIRTHDISARASEDILRLRPRGHYDRLSHRIFDEMTDAKGNTKVKMKHYVLFGVQDWYQRWAVVNSVMNLQVSLPTAQLIMRSRDSSVCIATGWTGGLRFPGGTRHFLFSTVSMSRLGPTQLPIGGSFPG